MTVVDGMSIAMMREFFLQLEHAGFVRVRIPQGKKTKPKRFVDRSYGLVKNTGALCPVWVPKQKRMYDRNTQEMQVRDPVYVPKESKKIEHRPVDALDYDRGRIVQILETVEDVISFEDLQSRSGVPYGAFMTVVSDMKEKGEVLMRGTWVTPVERSMT